MKILNLYAGIGGNRKLWGDEHEITAIENNSEVAKIYSDFFPNDKMIITDAHEYLSKHFKEFDFIWSSPPCPSHSQIRYNLGVRLNENVKPIYPDLKLYEEILFLQYHAKYLWIVENTRPYYKPLIPGKLLQRHLFWSNFYTSPFKKSEDRVKSAHWTDMQKRIGLDISKYNLSDKRQILRNCVSPKLGLHILNWVLSHRNEKITTKMSSNYTKPFFEL